MRIKIIIPVILFSFIFSGVAHAQITVLPKGLDDLNACKKILNSFEIDGKIPAAKQLEEDANLKQLGDAYESASKNAQEKKTIAEMRGCKYNAGSGQMEWPDDKSASDADSGQMEGPDDQSASGQMGGPDDKSASDRVYCVTANQAIGDEESTKSAYENAKVDSVGAETATADDRMNLLGCAIKTGRISLAMLPYFVTYFANYLLGIVGILVVLFIVLGGYFYIWGGLTEKKEKGKQYITHALMGLAVASIAWILVNAVMALFTS